MIIKFCAIQKYTYFCSNKWSHKFLTCFFCIIYTLQLLEPQLPNPKLNSRQWGGFDWFMRSFHRLMWDSTIFLCDCSVFLVWLNSLHPYIACILKAHLFSLSSYGKTTHTIKLKIRNPCHFTIMCALHRICTFVVSHSQTQR